MAELWQATLAGLAMDGTPDASGVVWTVEDIEGWDSPPMRMDDGLTTGRHGGFGSSRLYAPRLLTVSGLVDCPDMAAAFAVRDRLHGLMVGTLVVHESPEKAVDVVSGGPPRSGWPLDVPRPWLKWQLSLVAHDPFKRATTSTVTSIGAASFAAVPNAGTATADLEVTLTTGGSVVLSVDGYPPFIAQDLPAGTVIDTASTSVTGPDGSDLFTSVTMPPMWPAVPPGGGTVQQVGTANLSVETFPTYA